MNGRSLMVPQDYDKPNAPVVAIGVRGDPSVDVHLRVAFGALLDRAKHTDGEAITVHMDDLSHLAELFGVDFEFTDDGVLIPMPLHVDGNGRELTEDEL